jgi:pimeloyl-ACP methyl ester carboxylesterase
VIIRTVDPAATAGIAQRSNRSPVTEAETSMIAHDRPRHQRRLLVIAALIGVLVLLIPVGLVERRLRPARVPLTDDPEAHGLSVEVIAFPSLADGVTLRGWYLPAPRPSGRTIVISPGIDANREVDGITLALAPALLSAGWDVLAFDLRGEGQSDGATQTFGWSERWDVLGAVAEARRRGAERVVGLGFSMGGAATIMAAAGSPTIDAVIADSAYARLDAALRHELEGNLHLPGPRTGRSRSRPAGSSAGRAARMPCAGPSMGRATPRPTARTRPSTRRASSTSSPLSPEDPAARRRPRPDASCYTD